MPIIVLGIYVVVGAALVTIFSWGRLIWFTGKKGTDTDTTGSGIIDADEEIVAAAIPPG